MRSVLLLLLLLAPACAQARPDGVFSCGMFTPQLVADYFTGLLPGGLTKKGEAILPGPLPGAPAKKLGCDRDEQKPEFSYKLVAGDLNGDGLPDFISGALGSNAAVETKNWHNPTIFINGGTVDDPIFNSVEGQLNNGITNPWAMVFDTSAVDPSAGLTEQEMAIGDLNGDGRNDIIMAGMYPSLYRSISLSLSDFALN